jgi:acyl carrier protein
LKNEQIRLDCNLKLHHGIDSLDTIDILNTVETMYGKTIIDKDIFEDSEQAFQEAARKTFKDVISCLQYYINKLEGM